MKLKTKLTLWALDKIAASIRGLENLEDRLRWSLPRSGPGPTKSDLEFVGKIAAYLATETPYVALLTPGTFPSVPPAV